MHNHILLIIGKENGSLLTQIAGDVFNYSNLGIAVTTCITGGSHYNYFLEVWNICILLS